MVAYAWSDWTCGMQYVPRMVRKPSRGRWVVIFRTAEEPNVLRGKRCKSLSQARRYAKRLGSAVVRRYHAADWSAV